MNMKKLTILSAVLFTAAFTGASHAQTTTAVVDDNYAVDGTAMTDASFFGTSGSNAIEINSNSIGLVTGSSGRQIHGLFPSQSLEAEGDILTVSLNFLTPATVANLGSDDMRIGLFDDLGRTSETELAQNLSASSSSPEVLVNGLHGVVVELDVDPGTATNQDINIRQPDPSETGRLLGTNTGIPNLSSSADNGYVFAANTTYNFTLILERVAGDLIDVTATLSTVDMVGALTTVDTHNDDDYAPTGTPASFSYGMIGLGASTNAFGSSNTAGEADNGVDITSLNIDFFDADGVVDGGGGDEDTAEVCFTIPNTSGGTTVVCL